MENPAPNSAVQVEHAGPVTVVKLTGRVLLDELVVRGARQELFRLAEAPGPIRLVVNFSEVRQFGSAFLAVLIELNNKVKSAGGRLDLCGLNSHLQQVFEVTRLDKAFNLYLSEESAVNST